MPEKNACSLTLEEILQIKTHIFMRLNKKIYLFQHIFFSVRLVCLCFVHLFLSFNLQSSYYNGCLV